MKKNLLTGAIILTMAGFISNVLAFMYRIFLSNALGAEGMGLYHLVISVYMLAWSIVCSGFTITISKLTAQENAKGQNGNALKILSQSITITLSLGAVIALVIYFLADIIATNFFQEARIVMSLRILAIAIPFMAIASCVKGYIYGLQNMLIPAISQVLENIIKIAIVILIINNFTYMSITQATAVAVLGIVAQEIFSFIFLFATIKRKLKRESTIGIHFLTKRAILYLILPMALPLTLNHIIGSLLFTLESALIPQRLQSAGLSATDAIGIFGQLMGMAIPLIYFPTSFLTSLSITLVPVVSETSAIGNDTKLNHTFSKSILIASLIGHGVAGSLMAFSWEFGMVVYNQDISSILFILGIVCPLLYMRIVLSGILNGMGFQTFIFQNSLLSSAIIIGSIYFIMPYMGVYAYIFGWFLSLLTVYALELIKLREHTNLRFEFLNWFAIPTLAVAAAGLIARLIANQLPIIESGSVLGLILSVLLLAILYMVFIIATGLISISDIKKSFIAT